MKKIFFLCVKGVGAALSFFAIGGMVFDLFNGGVYEFTDGTYSKMVVGTIVVGVGFSIPVLIYENANLPYAMKVLIHMGIGCIIFLVVGYTVGWIPMKYGLLGCVVSLALELGAAFLLWFAFSWHYKKEAKRMDERFRELEKEKSGRMHLTDHE